MRSWAGACGKDRLRTAFLKGLKQPAGKNSILNTAQKAERFFLIICAYKESNRKSLIPAVLLIADGMSGILKSGDMIKTQDA